MSASLTIQADSLEKLRRDVDALGTAVTGDAIKLELGRAAQQIIKEHFEHLANDSAHHKTARSLGAEPTGLYEEAARGTQQPQLEPSGVSISINQVAIAQRYFGGRITPVNAKFLAIPARTETYGKRPRQFKNLRPIIFASGAGALVERDASISRGRGKGSEIGGGVYFWLVKSVTQPADPSVLPTEEEILDPAIAAANKFIDLLWQQKAAA